MCMHICTNIFPCWHTHTHNLIIMNCFGSNSCCFRCRWRLYLKLNTYYDKDFHNGQRGFVWEKSRTTLDWQILHEYAQRVVAHTHIRLLIHILSWALTGKRRVVLSVYNIIPYHTHISCTTQTLYISIADPTCVSTRQIFILRLIQ